jgi:hypothetical protein
MSDKPDYMQKARGELNAAQIPHFAEGVAFHARTLEALDTERAAHEATKAELQAFLGFEESALNGNTITLLYPMPGDAEKAYNAMCKAKHALLPAPEPDPLVEALDWAMQVGPYSDTETLAARLRERFPELTRHGLTITAIGGKP